MKRFQDVSRVRAALTAAVCLPAAVLATEWFVAPDGSDAADGTTEQTAFRTIQKAVDTAAEGDTVTLLPGDHTAGETTVNKSPTRVAIDKPITLRSRDGRDTTRIVGAWSTVESTALPWGIGPGAVRCVWVKQAATGTRLEGLTFADGAALASEGNNAANGTSGGGVMVTSGASATIVDCAFIDCEGTNGGGLFCDDNDAVVVARTLFKRCRSSNYGFALRGGTAYNCVFDDNGRTRFRDGTLANTQTIRGAVNKAVAVVNCTFTGNDYYGIGGDGTIDAIYNCVFVKNGYVDASTGSARALDIATSYVKAHYNCVTDVPDRANEDTGCVYVPFDDAAEVFSPADGDYRLVANAPALTAGSAEWLEKIPEEFRDKDFYGNPRATDGVVYAGAVQGAADATASGILLRRQADGEWIVGGETLPVVCVTWKAAVGWPAPILVRLAPASGVALVRYSMNSTPVWPRRDNAIWAVSEKPGAVRAVTPIVTKNNLLWADAENGDDDTADGSEDKPYATLQGAIDKAVSTGGAFVIHAKAGDYAKGTTTGNSLACRVVVPTTLSGNLRVLAVDGPETTFITGAADSSDASYGLGNDAVRCLSIASSGGNYAAFQGFTLRDGHTSGQAADSGHGGVLVNANGDTDRGTGWLVDCIVTNCTGQMGAVAFGGNVLRCKVYDSRCKNDKNGLFRGCSVISTFVTGCGGGNEAGTAVFAAYAYGYNCTLYANNRSAIYQSDTTGIVNGLRNCVAAARLSAGYDLYRAKAFSADRVKHTLYAKGDATAVSALDETVVCEDPVAFVDATSGNLNLRLREDSAGQWLASADYMKSCMDVNGDPFVFDADGNYQAGCFAPLSSVPSATVYVDAANGDDANDGATEATAFRTLAAAMADRVYGDTVVALPGTYDAGTMLQSLAQSGGSIEPTLPARVVVQNGVTLVSRDGAATTVIKGAASTATDAVQGCGDGAVRGVFLCRNATVRGFTITDGHTYCTGVSSVNEYGGAVAGHAGATATDAEFSGLVEDCLISGNVARVHNSQYGTYRNCRFIGNSLAQNKMGHAVSRARLEGCYFEGNGPAANHSTIYCSDVINCTVRGNQAGHTSSIGAVCNEGDYALKRALVNSIVEAAKITVASVTNCLLAETTVNLYAGTPRTADNITGDANLDAFGIPRAGSPAIDAGNNACAAAAFRAGRDGAGVRRVLNRTIDIGAYEYDWGVPWGAALAGNARLVITDMPSDATLTDGRLVFADGTVEMAWRANGGGATPYRFTAQATGDGTLSVAANGAALATLTAADGAQTFKVSSTRAENTFTFTCSGDGAALAAFTNESGTHILIR